MFTINDKAWDIKYVKSNDNRLKRSDGSITLAVTNNIDKCVYINENLKGYMLDKVLCHELTHCFCFSYDIYIPIEQEEMLADFMSIYGREIIYLLDSIIKTALTKGE